MNNKKITKNKLLSAFLVFPLMIIAKYIQFSFLPKKFFYDGSRILAIMNGSNLTDSSYSFAANFFNSINIFHLSTLFQWSITLSLMASFILFSYLLKTERIYTVREYVFIYITVFLLDIYVFNLSKEIIQIIIFALCALVINSKKIKKTNMKIALILGIFILESIYFRVYYLILATLIPIIYFFINNNGRIKPFKAVLIVLGVFLLEAFIVSVVSPKGYSQIITARSSVNNARLQIGDKDTNTMIMEVFGQNVSFLTFSANYVLDFFRLVLPVELFIKGVIYSIFAIYQIFLTGIVFALLKACKADKRVQLALSVIIGFMMISAIFEPDFGSFVRHQCCIAPILIAYCIGSNNKVLTRMECC